MTDVVITCDIDVDTQTCYVRCIDECTEILLVFTVCEAYRCNPCVLDFLLFKVDYSNVTKGGAL